MKDIWKTEGIAFKHGKSRYVCVLAADPTVKLQEQRLALFISKDIIWLMVMPCESNGKMWIKQYGLSTEAQFAHNLKLFTVLTISYDRLRQGGVAH